MRNFLTLILIGLMITGCSPSAHINPNPPEAANPTPIVLDPIQGNTVNPIQDNTAVPTSLTPGEKYIDLAKHDLAARLKIDAAQITVVHVTQITGADLASGCILKGGQVLMPNDSVNGYQISLEAQGQNYLYHAGSNDQVVLCQNMNVGPGKPLHNPTPDLSNATPTTQP
jgi:hypothetical protein